MKVIIVVLIVLLVGLLLYKKFGKCGCKTEKKE
jgi:hypothetical protein